MAHDSGQVVSVRAFVSNDPCLNPQKKPLWQLSENFLFQHLVTLNVEYAEKNYKRRHLEFRMDYPTSSSN